MVHCRIAMEFALINAMMTSRGGSRRQARCNAVLLHLSFHLALSGWEEQRERSGSQDPTRACSLRSGAFVIMDTEPKTGCFRNLGCGNHLQSILISHREVLWTP